MLFFPIKISFCDVFFCIYIDIVTNIGYNNGVMIIQNVLLSSESYTHKSWVYINENSGFSRMYYIIDGDAFYEEDGKKIKFKKGHLYFTPTKKAFNVYDDPENQL